MIVHCGRTPQAHVGNVASFHNRQLQLSRLFYCQFKPKRGTELRDTCSYAFAVHKSRLRRFLTGCTLWCDETLFPISRSLSTSRRRTDELGYRLERPIHFECKLNEPMHIGMRLLHPAAADHSVSINRQQVQRIFSFSLRSRAVTSFCS